MYVHKYFIYIDWSSVFEWILILPVSYRYIIRSFTFELGNAFYVKESMNVNGFETIWTQKIVYVCSMFIYSPQRWGSSNLV